MAMNLDALLRIKADVQGANNIQRLGNSLQGLEGKAKNLGLSMKALGATLVGSAITGSLTAVIKKSIDAGDELFNLQAKTGVAANALIGIGNAAKLADVDVNTLGKGLNKLNVNLVKAAEGNEDLASKFQALGVNVKTANGQVVPADKALKQIADRFADMPDGAQKAAAAVALFGKSGADLIPLLNEGAAAMEKFTYKVGDDFAARSDLFNDTITELGIKTQGFGLELTDALLPALQSILEVFSDLFSTDQDWTALFKVIEGVIRGIAVAIYTVIKAVDILIKNVVAAVQAAGQALSGDFGAAWDTITGRVSSGFAEAQQAIKDLNKLAFGSAASPGTGRRTGGRGMALDTSEADKEAEAAARRAAAAAKRAASEQERLLERRQALEQQAYDMQEKLRRSIEDTKVAYVAVGASATEALLIDRDNQLTEATRIVNDLTDDLVDLANNFAKVGVSFDMKPTIDLINQLGTSLANLADKQYQQGFSDYWLSQTEGIKEATAAAWEFARAQQYNADVIGGLRDGMGSYIKSIGTMREGMAQLAQTGIQGVEDAIFSLVTTGSANFKEFAADILKQTARMIIQQLILKTIMQALGAISGGGFGGIGASTQFNASGVNFNPAAFSGSSLFAMGGIMTGDGPVPLKRYASGGIANSPQLAMFGEGSMPEAYVPLPDGRRIPVAMQGGGGSTTVNVSVDAKGTQVQGSAGQGEQLGRVIAGAVQAELLRQKRPGGLLAA